MTKPLVPIATHRRRGNPDWGKFIQPIPAVATQFELQVKQLGLTKQTYTTSARLRAWCEDNKNRYYIPEWLLEEWEITVDPMGGIDRRDASPNRTSLKRISQCRTGASCGLWKESTKRKATSPWTSRIAGSPMEPTSTTLLRVFRVQRVIAC
jgi:hypothetical protein